MHTDIVDLRAYYSSAPGRRAGALIGAALDEIGPPGAQERFLGFGYTIPWQRTFGAEAERRLCFMPAGQGAVRWPQKEPSLTALVFEEELPLPDAAVDCCLAVHALEHAQSPLDTLGEFWRVLAPNGRLILVVPNRRGLWARFEHTPFGTGRPFSQGQIRRLLKQANFSVDRIDESLHAPPFKRPSTMRFERLLGLLGRSFWPIFGGVLVIEARKRLYQGLPVAERRSRRVFVPVLAPQGAQVRRERLVHD